MKYTSLMIGETEYKLRLGAVEIVNLEKKLGKNPLDILMAMEDKGLPQIGELLTILHAAMQRFEHGITMERIYELYDSYVESGKDYTDLIKDMLEVFKVSGFFKQALTTGKAKK